MERLNNCLYYILVTMLVGIASFFFHSYQLAVITMCFAAAPFISLVLFWLSKGKTIASLAANEGVCKRGDEYVFKVMLHNRGIMPVLNCQFKLEMTNGFSQQTQSRYINTSVPAFGRRIVEISLKPVLCGRINVELSELTVKDIMSFFQIKSNNSVRYAINVMPRRVKTDNKTQSAEGVSDESENSHKDSAGSEVVDIREYLRGDSLKAIHWKLSAKKDELFVREKGDSISDRPILLFELDESCINGILDTVYAVVRHSVKDNRSIKVCWAGRGNEQLVSFIAEEESDIYRLFEKVYLSLPTNSEGHTLSVAKRQLTGGSVYYVECAEKGVTTVDL